MTAHASIIIIDDNPDICELTKLFLEPLGQLIYIATNKEEAQLLLTTTSKINHNTTPISFILLDKSIENLTLNDVRQMLTNNKAYLSVPPIVAFTAADTQSPDTHLTEGFDNVLTKPFSPEDLLSIANLYKIDT